MVVAVCRKYMSPSQSSSQQTDQLRGLLESVGGIIDNPVVPFEEKEFSLSCLIQAVTNTGASTSGAHLIHAASLIQRLTAQRMPNPPVVADRDAIASLSTLLSAAKEHPDAAIFLHGGVAKAHISALMQLPERGSHNEKQGNVKATIAHIDKACELILNWQPASFTEPVLIAVEAVFESMLVAAATDLLTDGSDRALRQSLVATKDRLAQVIDKLPSDYPPKRVKQMLSVVKYMVEHEKHRNSHKLRRGLLVFCDCLMKLNKKGPFLGAHLAIGRLLSHTVVRCSLAKDHSQHGEALLRLSAVGLGNNDSKPDVEPYRDAIRAKAFTQFVLSDDQENSARLLEHFERRAAAGQLHHNILLQLYETCSPADRSREIFHPNKLYLALYRTMTDRNPSGGIQTAIALMTESGEFFEKIRDLYSLCTENSQPSLNAQFFMARVVMTLTMHSPPDIFKFITPEQLTTLLPPGFRSTVLIVAANNLLTANNPTSAGTIARKGIKEADGSTLMERRLHLLAGIAALKNGHHTVAHKHLDRISTISLEAPSDQIAILVTGLMARCYLYFLEGNSEEAKGCIESLSTLVECRRPNTPLVRAYTVQSIQRLVAKHLEQNTFHTFLNGMEFE